MRFKVHGIFLVYCKAFLFVLGNGPPPKKKKKKREREVMVRLECVLKMNDECLRFDEMKLIFKFKKLK